TKTAPTTEIAPAAQATAARAEGVSPRAKNAAEKLGVDPTQAAPTGPHGRVIERDVLELAKESRFGGEAPVQSAAVAPAAQKAAEAPAAINALDYDEIKLPNLRRMIAKTMHDSLAEMAQLTHNTSFDATKVLAFRESLKAAPESLDLPKVTINDIILFAVSRVLTKHEGLNAHMMGDKIRYFKHVNLGIAVDTPRGLLVPSLFAAETKTLGQIAVESKTLAKSAIDGSINPDLLQGGTFTISNLGLYGIESFTPVINPPQVALLGGQKPGAVIFGHFVDLVEGAGANDALGRVEIDPLHLGPALPIARHLGEKAVVLVGPEVPQLLPHRARKHRILRGIARGHDHVIGFARHAHAVKLLLHEARRARRIGDQHHLAALRPKRPKRRHRRRKGRHAVVH
ncbi:MAG: hypothetical protein EOM69_12180, partial [Clostridia bacterium]|nr:hypothetical protein [Clostridia bacterium]